MELTRIKRFLVPAAWTLVGAQVLLQVALVMPLLAGRAVEFDAGLAWLSLLLALVVGLAVGWADAGRRGRPVAAAALVVVGTGTAVMLALGAISVATTLRVATAPWEVVAQVLLVVGALVVSVVALVALVRLLPHSAAEPAGVPPALPAEQEAPAGRAPVWQPDHAAGAAWHTAGAAATGAAATDWGRPSERGGWAAAGRPESANPARPALSGTPRPERAEGASPRAPIDFGPRSQPAPGPNRTEDPDATRVAPDPRGGTGAAAATGSPVNVGPEAIARRFADSDDDLTRPAPPGARRPPPRWTPLEDPTQPPPQS